MEKQISIIIPTYNMEKYIGKCLDSLLIPEFEQVEVLVVNDGSKDCSSEIAHSYARRYPDSIRVIDKPNGNYGSCINVALPLAIGRYVKVLDADDTFDTDVFSKFVNLLKKVDEDLLITPFVDIDENGEIIRKDQEDYYNVTLYRTYKFEDVKDCALDMYPTMHRLTYRRSLFNRFDYKQSEGISYTDTEWSMIPMSYVETILFTDLYLYRYLVGREGQTMDPNRLMKSMDQLFKVSMDMTCYFSSAVLSEERRDFLKKKIISFIKSNIFIGLRYGSQEVMDSIKEHDKWLEKNNPLMYEAVGDIRYDERMAFRLVRDLRKKGYPAGYKVPKHVLYRLSVKEKLDKLFK